MDALYMWVVRRRNPIVTAFVILNCLLALLWYFAFRTIVLGFGDPSWYYSSALEIGQIAIVTYTLTTIPGIARRFGKFYKPVSILMIFRRYIGITTFMLAFIHASIERLFWFLKGQMGLIPDETFQIAGFCALIILLSLFLTSNDWSVKRLGKWWDRLHKLTYVAAWLIFAHVALQRLSVWSVLAGVTCIAVLVSHIYAARKLKPRA